MVGVGVGVCVRIGVGVGVKVEVWFGIVLEGKIMGENFLKLMVLRDGVKG